MIEKVKSYRDWQTPYPMMIQHHYRVAPYDKLLPYKPIYHQVEDTVWWDNTPLEERFSKTIEASDLIMFVKISMFENV